MRIRFIIFILLLIPTWMLAQPPGYYNGTAGLKGAELKAQLHEIISKHVDFSYSQAKFIINYSDADPANEKNVILFYTQRSQYADTYGTGGDFINREHVWAKSHGAFADMRPMDGDAFNLRPADGSVNESRSNKDFGNVQPNGTQHPEATDCWYTSQRWEPGDATKGQVARIIIYMDTRYEGTNGELNLTAVNGFNTSPQPEHGDLATLLEWNRLFPPSDFERRRNERIFSIQQNRNPFIDHPEWADLIWADAAVNPVQINNLQMEPEFPLAGSEPVLSFNVTGVSVIDEALLYWGKTPGSEEWTQELDRNNNNFQVPFSLAGFQANEMVYFKIVIKTRDYENSMEGSFRLPRNISPSQLTPITEVQGTTDISPLSGQVVNIAGTIVANFDNTVYIQTGKEPYSGVCVYGSLTTGHVGDSVVVTGKIEEFNRLTEITNVSYIFNHRNNKAVEPLVITASQVGEAYEGMLVTIENVTFDNGGTKVPDSNVSYTFRDATGSATVFSRYSSRLLNKQIPTGITNVTGVVSQYQNDYQLLPRDILDFSAGNDTLPPRVLAVTAIDKSWITVDFDERVDQQSSENIENYEFSGSIQGLSAYRYEEGSTVIINVEGLTTGTHSLTISGIKDQNNNIMEPATLAFSIVISSVDVMNTAGLKVYPNPVNEGYFKIESKEALRAVAVQNLAGQTIRQVKVDENESTVKVDFKPGIYLLNAVFDSGKSIIQQLIVL